MGWMVGDLVADRFEVLEILGGAGRSGMGVLYVVFDRSLKRRFAVKTFQSEASISNPRLAEWFRNECAAWLVVGTHPNIVAAQFLQLFHEQPHLFLEYVSGGDLRRWIGTPQLTRDPLRALQWAMQVCDALGHMAVSGISAHGDVKPANCLLTEAGDIKLSDFGLVTTDANAPRRGLAHRFRSLFTSRSAAVDVGPGRDAARGTPAYMAPELLAGESTATVRSDVYAVGVLLHEMMCGVPLSAGSSSTVSIDPGVEGIVRRCLDPDPRRRFTTSTELRDGLADAFRRIAGRAPSPPRRGVPANEDRQSLQRAHGFLLLDRPQEALAICRAVAEHDRDGRVRLELEGLALAKLNRPREALAVLDRVILLDHRLVTARLARAEVLLQLQRLVDADAELVDILRFDEPCADAHALRARALLASGNRSEAYAHVDRALQLDRTSLPRLIELGETLQALDKLSEALACYDQALTLSPRNARAAVGKGMLLNGLKRSDDAYQWGCRLTQSFPNDPHGWIVRGQAALARCTQAGPRQSRADFTAAQADARACLERARSLGAPIPLEPLDAIDASAEPNPMEQLDQAIDGLHWDHAIVALDRLADLGTDVSNLRGMMLVQQGRFEEAVHCFEQALVDEASNKGVRCNLGLALENLGRLEEARRTYEEALAVDENDAEAWYRLALLHRRIVSDNAFAVYKAIDYLDKALALNPRYAKAWQAKAQMLSHDLGRKAEAQRCIDQAIQNQQYDADAWLYKGAHLMMDDGFSYNETRKHMRQLDEAEQYLERALELGHPQAARFLEACRRLKRSLTKN